MILISKLTANVINKNNNKTREKMLNYSLMMFRDATVKIFYSKNIFTLLMVGQTL